VTTNYKWTLITFPAEIAGVLRNWISFEQFPSYVVCNGKILGVGGWNQPKSKLDWGNPGFLVKTQVFTINIRFFGFFWENARQKHQKADFICKISKNPCFSENYTPPLPQLFFRRLEGKINPPQPPQHPHMSFLSSKEILLNTTLRKSSLQFQIELILIKPK